MIGPPSDAARHSAAASRAARRARPLRRSTARRRARPIDGAFVHVADAQRRPALTGIAPGCKAMARRIESSAASAAELPAFPTDALAPPLSPPPRIAWPAPPKR